MGATITAAQWDAILAHELCHAERRDNLTAAIAAVAGPVLMGMMEGSLLRAQTQPTERLAFEVASIRENKTLDARDGRALKFLPGGRVAKNIPLIIIIAAAYELDPQSPRLTTAPGVDRGIGQAWFSIEATPSAGTIPEGATITLREEKMRQKKRCDRCYKRC